MLAYLKGEIISKSESALVITAGGIGFEVNMAQASAAKLEPRSQAELFLCESISPYDGTSLYGFLTREEKELFLLLRESVPGTGAKKALEYLNKALKSLPDFQRAIAQKDARLLTGIFGFTGKTAEKLINSLKDKIPSLGIAGEAGLKVLDDGAASGLFSQVLIALSALGYSPAETRRAIEALRLQGITAQSSPEEAIRRALRELAS